MSDSLQNVLRLAPGRHDLHAHRGLGRNAVLLSDLHLERVRPRRGVPVEPALLRLEPALPRPPGGVEDPRDAERYL